MQGGWGKKRGNAVAERRRLHFKPRPLHLLTNPIHNFTQSAFRMGMNSGLILCKVFLSSENTSFQCILLF